MTLVGLDDLLRRSDHLVVAAPLTAATTGLLGAEAFAKVRAGIHLVNVARGGIVDTSALIAALETGRVGFASLDVTDPEPLPPGHPLWAAPNVRITPHVAWSSPRTGQRIFALFADNLARFARGERLINQLGACAAIQSSPTFCRMSSGTRPQPSTASWNDLRSKRGPIAAFALARMPVNTVWPSL